MARAAVGAGWILLAEPQHGFFCDRYAPLTDSPNPTGPLWAGRPCGRGSGSAYELRCYFKSRGPRQQPAAICDNRRAYDLDHIRVARSHDDRHAEDPFDQGDVSKGDAP